MLREFGRFFCLAILTLGPATSLFGETWAEKLGFPAGRPVVILTGREMGICWECNEANETLLAGGQLSSAAFVVTGPRFNDVAKWSRQHPDVDLGIGIAMTNPYDSLTWRLLTSELGPTSIVNGDGMPWKTVVQFALSVEAVDVKTELDAQLSLAFKAGIRPTHIHSYYGTMFSRTDLAAVILGASKKYWIPAPVVDLTPELVERFKSQGYPIDSTLQQLIEEYPLPKLDDIRLAPGGATYEQTRDAFCDMVRSLNGGLTMLVFRPAEDSKGLRSLTPDWQIRVWQYELLQDKSVADAMQEAGVIVTNYREIMARFEGKSAEIVDAAEASETANDDTKAE